MTWHTLVLNIDNTPLERLRWREAMELVLCGKADLVEEYADAPVHTSEDAYPRPAVIRLTTGLAKRRVKLSRKNILGRDNYQCAYCGRAPRKRDGRPKLGDLNVDHVVPRAQARDNRVKLPWSGRDVPVTCWENVVTSCVTCNSDKADRTPAQAGLQLRTKPRRPTPEDIARIRLVNYRLREEWRPYLQGEQWAEYWSVELNDD